MTVPGAKSRAAVVALASTVASEGEARFMVNTAAMAHTIATDRDPIASLDVAGRVVTVRTHHGRMVVPAPSTMSCGLTQSEASRRRSRPKGTKREVLITGLASDQAREALTAAGWKVSEHNSR